MSGRTPSRSYGSTRVAPEGVAQLRRLLAGMGRDQVARLLGIGPLILERAADPHELLHADTVVRVEAALEKLTRAGA